jgi:hypothetical protein
MNMKYKHNWKMVLDHSVHGDDVHCQICGDVSSSLDNQPTYGCTPPKDQDQKRLIPIVPTNGVVDLPNGCTLYWELNDVGGRTYTSDEIGDGVLVWDTALIDVSTLMAAMTHEATLVKAEEHWAKKRAKNK